MEQIYEDIWNRARPYYLKGRPMDVTHIEWMMKEGDRISDAEHLDKTILLPLIILHDVGYSQLKNSGNVDYYAIDNRKAHMEKGAGIAKELLESFGYPKDKTETIVRYVGMHDAWAYGEVDAYINDPILGTFKDLDYIWIFHPFGCSAIQKVLGKTNKEMLEYLKNEPSPIGGKKPFSNTSTKKLHDEYLGEREISLSL